MDNQPKKVTTYRFFCRICGKEIIAIRKDHMCCSITCRVALSNIMRYSIDPEPLPELTEDEKKEAAEKTAGAKLEKTTSGGTGTSENPILKLGKARRKPGG